MRVSITVFLWEDDRGHRHCRHSLNGNCFFFLQLCYYSELAFHCPGENTFMRADRTFCVQRFLIQCAVLFWPLFNL